MNRNHNFSKIIRHKTKDKRFSFLLNLFIKQLKIDLIKHLIWNFFMTKKLEYFENEYNDNILN